MTEMVFKKVLLLFIISFIIYCPILVNNYIGDDNIIIGRNTFYKSWNNLTRLFKKGYISNPREIYFNHEASYDFGTGSVSYRPVSNFIYFFDVHFFNAQPLGSHLINLVIHSVNTGIVYLIVFGLFNSNIFAFFTALFFSLHPIQSEAVSVMSYRADILSAMFCFSSFYCWIKFKQGNYSQKWYGFKSLFLYFLGLFSKESVLPLPILIFLIDELIGTKAALRKRIGYYFIFLLIASGYLYIYFFVFKNISMHFYFIGGSLVSHVAMMGYICSKYLNCIFFPWTVKLIPGLYVPSTFDVEKGLPSLVLFLSILFCIYFILWNYFKVLFIFLSWFLLFYLPVSNIIPIANPIASRFIYLPSMGLIVVIAYFLYKCFELSKLYSKKLPILLYISIILICGIKTFFLNGDWRSNFDVGWAWIRDYPNNPRGYALLGREYFDVGLFDKAKEYLEKSFILGNQLPTDNLILVKCYIKKGEIVKAKELTTQILISFPDYKDAFDIYNSLNI